MSTQLEKDKLIPTSTAKFGVNSKGNTRLQLYLDNEVAEEVAKLLIEKKDGGAGTGVKLDIHQSKTTLDDGRQIEGAFFFVKSKMGQNSRQTQTSYEPKNKTADIAEKLKAKQV